MAERAQLRAPTAAGFTLIEMMVALSILVVGVTTLLAALGDSMSLRNSADARLLAAEAVEDYVHELVVAGTRRRADGATDLDLELVPPPAHVVAGYSGMRLSATVDLAADRYDVWLVHVKASWLEQGQPIEAEFLRVLPRQLPLGVRVQRFRSEHDIKR